MRCDYEGCSMTAVNYLCVAHAGVEEGICQSEVIALCRPHLILLEKRFTREFKQAFRNLVNPTCAHCDTPLSRDEMLYSTPVLSIP